jgi:hypothetical protein
MHMQHEDEIDEGPAFLKEGPDLSAKQNIRRPAAAFINPNE